MNIEKTVKQLTVVGSQLGGGKATLRCGVDRGCIKTKYKQHRVVALRFFKERSTIYKLQTRQKAHDIHEDVFK